MPSPYREQHDQFLRSYQATGEAKAIGRIRHVEARRKSGETFPIELSVSEARVGDTVLYSAIIRDVSERARMEAALRERMRRRGRRGAGSRRARQRPRHPPREGGRAGHPHARRRVLRAPRAAAGRDDALAARWRGVDGWAGRACDGSRGNGLAGGLHAARESAPSCSTISGPRHDSRHPPFSASTGSYPASAS